VPETLILACARKALFRPTKTLKDFDYEGHEERKLRVLRVFVVKKNSSGCRKRLFSLALEKPYSGLQKP